MALISFAGTAENIVGVRKAVLRMILSRAKSVLSDPSDRQKLDTFLAVDAVMFDELADPGQRERLIDAVYRGTRMLREDIAQGKETEEPVRPGIEEKLDEVLHLFDRFAGASGN
jgi:hypothetical protein